VSLAAAYKGSAQEEDAKLALDQALKLDPESVRAQAIASDWQEKADPLEQDLQKEPREVLRQWKDADDADIQPVSADNVNSVAGDEQVKSHQLAWNRFVHEGFLKKLSPRRRVHRLFMPNWQKRYLLLSTSNLYYFVSKQKASMLLEQKHVGLRDVKHVQIADNGASRLNVELVSGRFRCIEPPS
jgi:hypothetical protein